QIAPGSGVVTTSSTDQIGSGGQFGTSFGTPSRANGRVRQQLGVMPPIRGMPADSSALPAGPAALPDPRANSSSPTPALTVVGLTPDVVNNPLLIYASHENYRIIERALRQIDRPQMQVAIDATIAEVTLQFFLTSRDFGLKPDRGSALN